MIIPLMVSQKRRGRTAIRALRARERFLPRMSPHVFCQLRLPLHRLVAHRARERSEILVHETVAFQGGGAGKVLVAFEALECAAGVDGAHVVFLLRVRVKGHVTLFAIQTCPGPRTSHLLAFGPCCRLSGFRACSQFDLHRCLIKVIGLVIDVTIIDLIFFIQL